MNESAILAKLEEIHSELQAMRIAEAVRLTIGKTPRQMRLERRHARLRELADATGLGRSWAAAHEVLLILAGRHSIPLGMERTVAQLQQDEECARSPRGIYRIIAATD